MVMLILSGKTGSGAERRRRKDVQDRADIGKANKVKLMQ